MISYKKTLSYASVKKRRKEMQKARVKARVITSGNSVPLLFTCQNLILERVSFVLRLKESFTNKILLLKF